MSKILLTLKTRNDEGFRNCYFSRNEAKKDITKYLRLYAKLVDYIIVYYAKSALDPSNWIKNYALSHIMSSKTGNLTNSSLSHGRTTKRPPPSRLLKTLRRWPFAIVLTVEKQQPLRYMLGGDFGI